MTKLNKTSIICEEIIERKTMYCKDIENNIILLNNENIFITLKGYFFLEECSKYYITSQHIIKINENENYLHKDILWLCQKNKLGFPIYECICISYIKGIETKTEFIVV